MFADCFNVCVFPGLQFEVEPSTSGVDTISGVDTMDVDRSSQSRRPDESNAPSRLGGVKRRLVSTGNMSLVYEITI